MSTLHERLSALADVADHPGTPAAGTGHRQPTGADLWDRAVTIRRHRRRGVAVVVASTVAVLAVLAVLAGVTWVRLPHVGPVPADAPAGIPDRLYQPSPSLPGTSTAGPLGPIAMVFATERRTSGQRNPTALMGVSATTGAYRFLDLPHLADGSSPSLSPDGAHLAYWTQGSAAQRASGADGGVAVYDASTGRSRTYDIASRYGIDPEGLVWVSADEVAIGYGEVGRGSGPRHTVIVSSSTLAWRLDENAPSPARPGWQGIVAAAAGRVTTVGTHVDIRDAGTGEVTERLPTTVTGWVSRPQLDPNGTRVAVLLGKTRPHQRGVDGVGPVSLLTAQGSRLVPGRTGFDELGGWLDDNHLVAEAIGEDGSGRLVALDVDTGATRTLTAYAADFAATGVQVAPGLAARGHLPAHRPPTPASPRLVTGLVTGTLASSLAALVVLFAWTGRRRRVRR